MQKLTQTLNNFLNLFLQSKCPLCQRATEAEFCQYCQRQLLSCKLTNSSYLWQGEVPVFAWGVYGGAIKRAIAALKYEHLPQLAQPLGYWLGEAWLKSPISQTTKKLIVVPIPLHSSKLKQRGYNQAELLAQSFCQFTGLAWQDGLERVRSTEAQFGLSQLQRQQNLAEAFRLSKKLQVQSSNAVLLLDDIYTTGATVKSAAKTLQQQGIQVYGLVAIATPKVSSH
ncbi:MAG TPA: ComF family protein [Oculatellaceae cyanobacterium]